MKTTRILAAASPYAAALGSGLLIAAMIATMSLTAFERQWTVFLSGVLAAAVFAFVSRSANTRWVLARRTAQLNAMRSKLVVESRLRKQAETSLARLEARAGRLDTAAVIASDDIIAPESVEPAAVTVLDDTPPMTAAERLIEALEHDEFSLYSQAIVPLGAAGDGASFCEVLLRMKEEEEKLLPPGTFLPVAEENGLLPDIDRWVIRNVLDAAAAHADGDDAVYFVNLTPSTVAAGDLAPYVLAQLAGHRCDGSLLCFEFPESDVIAQPRAYRDFISALHGSRCRFAVSGFGRNAASVQFLKQLRVDYVKLDGDIALNLARGAEPLARAQALIVAAHAAGMPVIAQCVENDATLALLRTLEADFAQGFGVAMPRPMTSATVSAARRARAVADLAQEAA